MSFNRTRYDKCAYDLQMGRSTGPGDYRLYGSFAENCNQCLSYDGPIGAKSDVSLVKKELELEYGSMADVESSLSWRHRELTKYNNDSSPMGSLLVNHKSALTNKLSPEDTRFTNPLDNYRSMSLTSYMLTPYLPVNPQCHILDSDDLIGLNSRLWSKDNFKPVMPKPLDQCADLPYVNVKNIKKDIIL
jgi:hypothetical protein